MPKERTVLARVAEWLEAIPFAPDEAERELAELRVEADKKRSVIDGLEDELNGLLARIETIETALALRERWAAGMPQTVVRFGPPPDLPDEPFAPQPERGRDAIRTLVKLYPPEKEWTIPSLVRELSRRGWADAGDHHAVGVSLSRLTKAGELERKRKGVYRLPSMSSNGDGGAVAQPLAGLENKD